METRGRPLMKLTDDEKKAHKRRLRREYYARNSERILARQKQYKLMNPEKAKQINKNINAARLKRYREDAIYREAERERQRDYRRQRYQNDPEFRAAIIANAKRKYQNDPELRAAIAANSKKAYQRKKIKKLALEKRRVANLECRVSHQKTVSRADAN